MIAVQELGALPIIIAENTLSGSSAVPTQVSAPESQV